MQVAIVTGASSGIGFACATTLAAQGMAVLGTGRDTDRLAALEEAVGSDRLATVAVDLTEDDAPQRIVTAALQRWGRIDYLINNAGIGSPKPLHETDDDTLDRFLALMLRAPFRLARDAEEITLRDILEPIEHLDRWEACFLGLPDCSDKDPCAVHDRWGELRDRYLEFLSATTLAEVMERYQAQLAKRRKRRRRSR